MVAVQKSNFLKRSSTILLKHKYMKQTSVFHKITYFEYDLQKGQTRKLILLENIKNFVNKRI